MSLALGSAIGRVGCLLNGCCYGVASDSAVACAFPATGARVLPTQLFDSAANLAIFGLLLAVAVRDRVRAGVVWWLYVVLYGVSRFTVEVFRVNPRGLLGLSQAQQISVLAFAAGVAGLVWMATHGGLREPGAGTSDEDDR
jgi:phosphatidylglycerol:prolipoprotein diacylglycerol transferase